MPPTAKGVLGVGNREDICELITTWLSIDGSQAVTAEGARELRPHRHRRAVTGSLGAGAVPGLEGAVLCAAAALLLLLCPMHLFTGGGGRGGATALLSWGSGWPRRP